MSNRKANNLKAIDRMYVGSGRVRLCTATLVPPLAELRYGPVLPRRPTMCSVHSALVAIYLTPPLSRERQN